MPGIDLTAKWGNKLAELAVQEVAAPPPAENVVNARLTDIDGAGIATLVSKLTQASETYGGFALILKHDTKYKDFEWLQFITRQLVVDNAAITGNLVIKTNTASYQLVNSAAEITNYAFAPDSEPSNWNTCWKVDSTISPQPKPFFREGYEYAISDAHKLSAILDAPGIMAGKKPKDSEKPMYKDVPDNLVIMKDALGTKNGISRAYFSDYLVKKVNGKWHIYARFDFSLTWNARDADKNSFTLRSLRTTTTTSLLHCHKAALTHKTTPGTAGTESKDLWEDFRKSIYP